jgi:hypothetical protein
MSLEEAENPQFPIFDCEMISDEVVIELFPVRAKPHEALIDLIVKEAVIVDARCCLSIFEFFFEVELLDELHRKTLTFSHFICF